MNCIDMRKLVPYEMFPPFGRAALGEAISREIEEARFDAEAKARGCVPERTCRNAYDGREFECSECGTQWHLLVREDVVTEWGHVRTPCFCPNCGAKVVSE